MFFPNSNHQIYGPLKSIDIAKWRGVKRYVGPWESLVVCPAMRSYLGAPHSIAPNSLIESTIESRGSWIIEFNSYLLFSKANVWKVVFIRE
jgi:hypothetical protein